MGKFQFSLSRAHSVADRLRQSAQAKQQTALATLGGTSLSHAPTAEQKTALGERGILALTQLAEARAELLAVGTIRAALATANAAAGVTTLLATIDAKRQEAKLLAQVTSIDLLTRVPLDQVAEALAQRPTSEVSMYGGRGSSGVPVTVVGVNALESLRVERLALEAEINALGDRVNDLNRTTVTVELEDSMAKVAGLA